MRTRRSTVSSFAGLFALLFVASGAVARAQEVERVSVDSYSYEANGASSSCTLSSDGTYVVFGSHATNLVANDTNNSIDVFVRDRVAGTTERVSVDSSGAEGSAGAGSGHTSGLAISSDGRIVAFDSDFVNLVANDTNAWFDVFVHDRVSGITERVSVDSSGAEGDHGGYMPTISADGRYVCFTSASTNLVPGDSGLFEDVFVHDRSTGFTERVSVDSSGIEGNDDSYAAAISADGRFVAFGSNASNLVAGDANGVGDIFVKDRSTGAVERISVDSNGLEADQGSDAPSISPDGNFIVYLSSADNLVAGDTNGSMDVFVRDRAAGTTERVSVDSSGHEANLDSSSPTVSGDGSLVAFNTLADNLAAGDTNRSDDVYLHDRVTGTTRRLSNSVLGRVGDDRSWYPAFSSDGKSVAFVSSASNLVSFDTNRDSDVFVCMLDRVKSRWLRYGAGWPGTNGIPSITPSADPTFGTTISITVANSLGAATEALLVLGYQRTLVPSAWGGDLLVDPLLALPTVLDAGGFTMTGDVPNDPTLAGFVFDLQALELDGGASRGVSFTDGLELVLGD